ncbi:deSI-like protein At4g17486 isoform X2 [Brachypodium distachyon]|uniref:deSI-like protein At4g17486 isoform X2 n=1 Tax=Brachypodium distachyon TaxID=15368 RepID=UPI00052FE87D|nr:deSI-like protein At4g17486 isoform X2 [Brachypodium distachyon]|eukprot:XP_010240206.1 deSI-like protein At4g17486 isoform X2 [Brachypodium distachyon]
MEAPNGSGGGGGAPVVLNVYDLTPINNYLYWFGLGIFHSGIEVHGIEYGFGAHDLPTSGVFEVEPKRCPGYIYRRSVWMGTTEMSRAEFRLFIETLAGKYNGNTYHLISKNCNHFTDDVCRDITRKPTPGWVNRLARVGFFFNRLLPKSIQVSAVGHVPTHPALSVIGDSDEDELDQHLLPAASVDLHPVNGPPKLAKDLL